MRAFLFAVISVIIFFNAGATSITSPASDSTFALIAKKGRLVKYYHRGDAIRIWYEHDSRPVKGYITRLGNDSIEITSFGGKLLSTNLSTSSIISVVKLKRKERKTIAFIVGGIGLLFGVLAIAAKGRLFDNAWSFAIIVIPALVAGYYFLFYFIATYLFELLSKRSRQRGWKFYTGMGPVVTRFSVFQKLFGK